MLKNSLILAQEQYGRTKCCGGSGSRQDNKMEKILIKNFVAGDKIQVYMYTHTGIMDKRSNWLTHFVGMFIRPKDFMKDTETEMVNGH